MRNRFDVQLEELKESMVEMGNACIHALKDTKESLLSGNHKKAREILTSSMAIRRMERNIEGVCLKLLLQQQLNLQLLLYYQTYSLRRKLHQNIIRMRKWLNLRRKESE